MLNNSHMYHQTQHDLKRRGIDGTSLSVVMVEVVHPL